MYTYEFNKICISLIHCTDTSSSRKASAAYICVRFFCADHKKYQLTKLQARNRKSINDAPG